MTSLDPDPLIVALVHGASPAGADSVQDTLRATIDKVMAVASTQSEEKTSVGSVALAG
jgi:hypothetical protein